MSMKLNVKKIRQLKKAKGLTWHDIARLGGANSRQAVFHFIKHESISGAELFAKAFKVNAKDLIK